jgi:hypothetical protein
VGTILQVLSILGQLLPTLLQAVQIVQKATGGTPAEAATAVAQHLTPGQPDHPALAATAKPPATT